MNKRHNLSILLRFLQVYMFRYSSNVITMNYYSNQILKEKIIDLNNKKSENVYQPVFILMVIIYKSTFESI